MTDSRGSSVSLLEALPAEIHIQLLESLPFSSQLSWRLASRILSQSATTSVFRRVRLSAAAKPSSFLSVAASDELCQHVRHVTLDVDMALSHRGARLLAAKPSDEPEIFLRALPQLNRFRGLRSLQMRFSNLCGNRGRYIKGPLEPEETNEYRYVVLDVVLHCLAGLWTETRQAELDAFISGDALADAVTDANASPTERTERETVSVFKTKEEDFASAPHRPVDLDTLTLINLDDSNDHRLLSSPAFQRILNLKSLQDLKLLVTFETSDSGSRDEFQAPGAGQVAVPKPPAKYEFLASLPSTWLRPSIAANLRTLMLYCGNYWGWCPKFDPRTINPQRGNGGGLPNLRVLGLGNFVFSHRWQAHWIAGLGRGDSKSGLEELYLDDCPIMWQGRIHGPLDESVTLLGPADAAPDSMDVDDDEDEDPENQHPLRLSNKGYPRTDIVTTSNDPHLVEYENTVRWHEMLNLWRERMTGLKVFAMGSGSFDSVSNQVGTSKNRPSREHKRASPNASNVPRCGMSTKREEVLQYIRYEGGFTVGPWVHRDFGQRMIRDDDGGLEAYEAIRRNDEVALQALITTADGR